jgi:Icc-related predicted phosphoesterase
MDITPMGDVLILAGDIHVGTRAESWIAQACKYYNAVIYVLGNHEFYHGEYHTVINAWKEIERKHPNLFVLHNETVVLDDIRFVGTTLWTNGDKPFLNDYNLIYYKNSMLQIIDTQRFHNEAVDFLLDEFEKPFNGETVVVTHHAPVPECVVPKYNGDKINCMFHANLGQIIADNDILAWVHGHMHDSIDFDYSGTRILCNPRGYVGYGANHGFEPNLIVEV